VARAQAECDGLASGQDATQIDALDGWDWVEDCWRFMERECDAPAAAAAAGSAAAATVSAALDVEVHVRVVAASPLRRKGTWADAEHADDNQAARGGVQQTAALPPVDDWDVSELLS
jgi:hypothetical protein